MNRTLAVVVGLLLVGAAVSGQQATFRSQVELVHLDVSVRRGGRPIAGLSADDFIVTDNGVQQQIEAVSERAPLSVTLLLDTSGSMRGERMQHLTDAADTLVEALRPEDRASLISFSHRTLVSVPLTANQEQMKSAIASLRANGATSIHDALFMAVELSARDETRPLILLFSDGADTSSWLAQSDILEWVRRFGVTIHTVSIQQRSQPFASRDLPVRDLLERVADACGGRAWSTTTSRDLRKLFSEALEEMRARYSLTYYPAHVKREGWHEVKVRLTNRSGEVTTRSGYYVRGE